MKLDAGAGKVREPGWTTLDKYAEGVDIQADIWAIPLEEGSAEEVYCGHVLEHLAPGDVVPSLVELLRVLEPGGKLRVFVPNMDYVAAYWLHGADRVWAQALVYGNQSHPGEVHRTGFTRELLAADLAQAGFERIEVGAQFTPEWNQESLVAEAYKPAGTLELPHVHVEVAEADGVVAEVTG